MKAARYYGPGDVRVEQIEEPQIRDGQLKIKIAWNGICGSDLHAYLATVPKFPTASEPNDLTGETLPITLGHEFSGTVVELGSGVDSINWRVGQNVIIEPLFSCRKTDTCIPCSQGIGNICPSANFIGVGGWGGGLAEYIAVDTRYVHALPEGISLEIGAMIEPLAVAWYAVKRSGFKAGQSALIIGGGPIGLFLLKVLRSIDPTTPIFLSEPAALRRSLAQEHGATLSIDPTLPLPSSAPPGIPSITPLTVLGATQGIGVDFAFDAAGTEAGLNDALFSLRPRGTFVNVAVWEHMPKVHMNLILVREITVIGTIGYIGIHTELLEAVAAGKFKNLEGLVTRKIGIEDVVQQGFLALLNEKDKQVKILVHP